MRIRVVEEDIYLVKFGAKESILCAIRRSCGPCKFLGVSDFSVSIDDTIVLLPSSARDFIAAEWRGEPLKPFSFDLDLPAEAIKTP